MRPKTIVFFDSDCLLCQASLVWLHRFDAHDHLLFAPLSGEMAKKWGLSLADNSMAALRDGKVYRASEAIRVSLLATGGLGIVLSMILRCIPLFVRNSLYRQIAIRRHFLVKSQGCGLPEEGLRQKILN